jgi:hypothetical protein
MKKWNKLKIEEFLNSMKDKTHSSWVEDYFDGMEPLMIEIFIKRYKPVSCLVWKVMEFHICIAEEYGIDNGKRIVKNVSKLQHDQIIDLLI